MPSTTLKQKHTMAAAAHNPAFARSMGIPMKVARDFNAADTGRKLPMPMADGGLADAVAHAAAERKARDDAYATQYPQLPPPASAPSNPAPTLSDASTIGQIKGYWKKLQSASEMAKGGLVRGPGTGTSDSIPAKLSAGEYVMPADTVRAVGKPALDQMRASTHTPVHMADGGVVDPYATRFAPPLPTLTSAPVPSGRSAGLALKQYLKSGATPIPQMPPGPGGSLPPEFAVTAANRDTGIATAAPSAAQPAAQATPQLAVPQQTMPQLAVPQQAVGGFGKVSERALPGIPEEGSFGISMGNNGATFSSMPGLSQAEMAKANALPSLSDMKAGIRDAGDPMYYSAENLAMRNAQDTAQQPQSIGDMVVRGFMSRMQSAAAKRAADTQTSQANLLTARQLPMLEQMKAAKALEVASINAKALEGRTEAQREIADTRAQAAREVAAARAPQETWTQFQNMASGQQDVMRTRGSGLPEVYNLESLRVNPTVTKVQVDDKAKAQGITDPIRLQELYKHYHVQ